MASATGWHTYIERGPAPALAAHLSCVWVQRVPWDSALHPDRTVPNGGVELCCRIGSTPRVRGPQTGPTFEMLDAGDVLVGVRFRPGAAPPALGVAASELVDLELGADELWGRAGLELGERLADAASPELAAAALEAAVLERLRDAVAPDPLVAEAVRRLHPWGVREVAALPSSLHVSERQLRRRCREAVGLAPKVVHRQLRFQGFLALAQRESPTDANLARLAAEAGYADQPHLTRESMRLAGRSPRTILLESERHCRGVHDHVASYEPLLRSRALAA